jgi:hypothetical protein
VVLAALQTLAADAGPLPLEDEAMALDAEEAAALPAGSAPADVHAVYDGGSDAGARRPAMIDLQPFHPFGIDVLALALADNGMRPRACLRQPTPTATEDATARPHAPGELPTPVDRFGPLQSDSGAAQPEAAEPPAGCVQEPAAPAAPPVSVLDALFSRGWPVPANSATWVLLSGVLLGWLGMRYRARWRSTAQANTRRPEDL